MLLTYGVLYLQHGIHTEQLAPEQLGLLHDNYKLWQQWYAQGGWKVHWVMPEIKNPLTPSMKDWLTFIQKWNWKMKQDFLIRKWYDAVVDLKGKYKQIMIVDPTQVKKVK